MTSKNRFAVLDCETTGFGTKDRIIELAIVVLDGKTLEVLEEFDTLINPQRDVGKTEIHGITAGMVSAAPIIDEVLPLVKGLIDGSTLVAHNLPFDLRMMKQECVRAGATLKEGRGICTYKLSGARLVTAAKSLELKVSRHHRAIEDARLASEILRKLIDGENGVPARLLIPKLPDAAPRIGRTLRRESAGEGGSSPLRRMLESGCIPGTEAAIADYVLALDFAMGDLSLSNEESDDLEELQKSLGLSKDQVAEIHRAYLESIVRAALRDGRISEFEERVIHSVASVLNIEEFELPTSSPIETRSLRSGMRVCFTGEFVDASGSALGRRELELKAASAGLQPVASVSKKGCDAVLAADVESQSGKCKKARELGIPVVSVSDFIALVDRKNTL